MLGLGLGLGLCVGLLFFVFCFVGTRLLGCSLGAEPSPRSSSAEPVLGLGGDDILVLGLGLGLGLGKLNLHECL